eukprot:scaffold292961_cov59-Attheya_sp.AAC.4
MGEQTQQSSLYQATEMQHMNAGYNPKFMAPMYSPADNQTQVQHYSQQLAGPHTQIRWICLQSKLEIRCHLGMTQSFHHFPAGPIKE